MNKWYSTEDYRVRKMNMPKETVEENIKIQKQYTTHEYNKKDYQYEQDMRAKRKNNKQGNQQSAEACGWGNQSKHMITCDCQKEQETCPCCCNGCWDGNGWWNNGNFPWNNNGRPMENMGVGGLEVQMNTKDLVINSGAAVPFNNQLVRYTPDLALVDGGRILVTQSGIYEIAWWVATESVQMGQDTYVAFGASVNGTQAAIGMSANAYGQVVGSGLVHIYASPYAPAYLQLINLTDAQIAYGQVPLKASLTITYSKG